MEEIREIDDPIENFKIQFKNSLKSQRLVLVIDELDRCRPDFAVKTLEVLKHFFDIDGLYVILMVNKERLEKHINAFYNILDNESNDENFLQKFINRYENIPDLDYKIIVGDYLISDRLKKAIENEYITIDEDNFNSLQKLSEGIIECCKEKQLTYRQAIELINKCIEFCNNYKAPIRCRYLAHVFFIDSNRWNVSRIKESFISRKTKLFDKIKDYAPMLKSDIPNIEIGSESNLGYEIIDKLFGEIKNKNNFSNIYLDPKSINILIKDYENLKLLGSDDNDKKRVKLYEDIGKDFNKLYDDKNDYI